jgi:hypothetical protein
MGYREYLLWCAYRKKYGPMNPIRKYDIPSAIVASQVNNAHGGKAKPLDFVQYGKDEESQEISTEQMIEKVFGGAVKRGR